MSHYSQERLESRLSQAISMMIVQGEIKNPNLSTLCSVTRVELSIDNAYATVFISSPLAKEKLEKSVAALQAAHSFIQKKVGAYLRTKNTPVLTFKADTSLEEGEKVNRLIDSLTDGK
ncbi:MAG: 30S ribosome-binding factor RbfA [Sphaerochaetaceae bacterium]|jgi:ribosome-binding factor A